VSTTIAETQTLPREPRGAPAHPGPEGGTASAMRPYEVMIILDSTLEEDAVRAAIDRSTGLIRDRGGDPHRVDRWGKRRFAYELNHRWDGYYVLVEATAEPSVMAELDRALHLADEVVRHKVIRLPDRVAARRRSAAGEEPQPDAGQM
jgi:small subunit ribosomal protein S6